MFKKPILFAGSSHFKLAHAICKELNTSLGQMHLSQFPDGETDVQILEEVRGENVFVLQSVAGRPNEYLSELLIIIDALKRGSSKSITAIIPYLGYSRQDRKNKPGMPITAKLVANLLKAAGITQLITVDLHSDQIEGFFETPVEHLHAQELLFDACKHLLGEQSLVVAPDIGSIKIAERMAKLLKGEMAVIKKERLSSFEVTMTLIGNVHNKNVLIVDDLCSTAGTLVAATQLCRKHGAKKVIAAVTHALFVNESLKKIEANAPDHFFITDTIQPSLPLPPFINTVSVAALLAQAIKFMSEIYTSVG